MFFFFFFYNDLVIRKFGNQSLFKDFVFSLKKKSLIGGLKIALEALYFFELLLIGENLAASYLSTISIHITAEIPSFFLFLPYVSLDYNFFFWSLPLLNTDWFWQWQVKVNRFRIMYLYSIYYSESWLLLGIRTKVRINIDSRPDGYRGI